MLVLAAEDYTGLSPVYKSNPRPAYLSYYLDALAANGIGADVYDVDANGRKAPSQLGVLTHYKAVIWYTGDDVITREPGMAAGTASRLANDEMLAVRAYLNEGGRLLYTGKYAGLRVRPGLRVQPRDERAVRPEQRQRTAARGCPTTSCSTTSARTSTTRTRERPRTGTIVRRAWAWTIRSTAWAGRSALRRQQPGPLRLVHHDERLLPRAQFPQFDSWAAAKYARPGGRSTRTPARTTCTRTSRTSATSA